jgi:hypothetical protein
LAGAPAAEARRLAPADSGLTASGPHGATALRLMRTYAE